MPEEEGVRAGFVVKKWGLAVMAGILGSGGGLEMRRPALSGGNVVALEQEDEERGGGRRVEPRERRCTDAQTGLSTGCR